MATAFQAYVHRSFEAPVESHQRIREVSGISGAREDVSNASHHAMPSPPGPWTGFGTTNTTLTELVRSLKLHNSNGMATSKIIGADYEKLLEWIRSERMRKLPPEGSSYDKVLVCAKLFVERLHSFDGAIQHFAQESNMATQLAYIHCASILEFGEDNSDALLHLFSFFYQCSFALENLLGRAELFTVSHSIKDQVILALADLVTLVVGIATQFHKSLSELQSGSVTIDIHSTFAGPIESFRTRCEHVSELMWKHQLSREGLVEGRVTEIKMMKRWLEPEDPVLTHVTRFTAQFAQEREESTCLWVTPHITRFLKSDQKSLVITGEPGSGKSILATVINEQLQHPIGGVSYLALFVPINSRIPGLATPLAVANSLLSHLYRTLSDTYQRCQQTVDEDQYVTSLKGAKQTVIITALLHRLNSATANVNNLKLIVLGSEKPERILGQSLVQITPELIFYDIAAVVRRAFESSVAFNTLAIEERETCVNGIVKGANASFLWAKLASKKVRDEGDSSAQGLMRAVSDLLKADYSINDFVSHALRSNVHQDGAKIIAWLATAARPLTIWELSAILSIQVEKGVITGQETDPLILLKPLAAFVFHQNDMVYLRHGRIRSAIVEALARDRSIAALKDTKLDFVRRISLYIKQAVTGRDEPSMDSPDLQLTSRLLERYPLLDFALRYWISFTRMAFGCTTDQEIATAGKELSHVFPTSTLVPLLEITVWKDKSTPMLKLLHDTQTRIYQQVLGSKHPATLQAVVCRALFYETIQNVQPSQASQIFYDAATACQQALSTQHIITMRLTKQFLDFTTNQVSTSRTDIMLKRVGMLRLLVECYKTHYGNTSDMVVSTLHQLVEHYKLINEVQKAQELTAFLKGSTSEAGAQKIGSRRPSEGSLVVQLHGPKDAIKHGTVLVLDDIEEDELVSSSFNFNSLLSAAQRYAREGNVLAAERTYVDIWQRVSKEYRLHQSIEWELRSLEFIKEYSKFLLSQKRESEVASILTSFWAEHGQKMSTTEEVVAKFVTVAQLMESLKLSWLALDVLKQCAQSISHHSSLYKEIHEHMQSSFKEVMQVSGTSTASTVTESSLVKMIFDQSVGDEITATATTTLVQMYLAKHRWRDATKALKRVLQAAWPSFFATSVNDVILPVKDVAYCIELAQHLRDCYRHRRRAVKEEDVCLRLYHAIRRDRPAGDEVLQSVTLKLVQLYERTRQTEKLISVHLEILNDYTTRFGQDHPMVLQELWALAELTHPQASSVGYYRRIFELLNKQSDICDSAAFEPLLVVVTELTNQERYSEALWPCKVLFNTLQHTRVNPRLHDAAFTHAEYHVIHDVTVQYRKGCLAVFGAQATIAIQATKTLAYLAQASKQYEAEAIELFEALLETQSSEIDIDYEDIRATLEAIYEEQYAVVSTTEGFSSQHFQRVITARIQRLSTIRSTYGWAHESSLSQMEEVVSLYHKRKDTNSATMMLEEAVVHIASSEHSSSRLIAAAESIVSSYRAIGQIQRAKKLALELYQQIVEKDTTNISSVGFDKTSSGRQSLPFLAQLEHSLREREETSLTMNEIYSSLVAEYQYFERFRADVHSKSSNLQSVLFTVSHLQELLSTRGHSTTATRLMEQLTDYFMWAHGHELQLERNQAAIFLSTIVEHLRKYSSQNFVRSIALASHNCVIQLLPTRDHHHSVCDLALAAFRYIRTQDGFSSLATVKLLFKMGLAISSCAIQLPHTEDSQSPVRQEMLRVSATIMKEVLCYCKIKNIDLSQLSAVHLNNLIKLLDQQKDYHNLAWILTALWDKREISQLTQTDDTYTLALGRMLVITHYLAGDYMSSIRLAEDIAYNCARVHGPRDHSTTEMTILLAQIYTSVAHCYQGTADHRELASQYYTKAAALHENALRVFIDPSSASTTTDIDLEQPSPSISGLPITAETARSLGECIRQHLHLLKLAVERLGNWPKDYSEYERLNSDLFRMFRDELQGIKGVDKWNLKQFGAGRAEASDDLISPNSFPHMDLSQVAISV
ncbi:hypothetical protein BDW72DRAFT_206899 [Aspergillus terricola var. indicus]